MGLVMSKEDLTGTNSEIRERAKKYNNGCYCVKICKNCGMLFTDPKAATKHAEIISKCRSCFEEKTIPD